jgi:hypothetical protein
MVSPFLQSVETARLKMLWRAEIKDQQMGIGRASENLRAERKRFFSAMARCVSN